MPIESTEQQREIVVNELAHKALMGGFIQRAAYLLAGQDEGVTWEVVTKALVRGCVRLVLHTRLSEDEFVEKFRAEYKRVNDEDLTVRAVVLPR